MSTFLDDNDSSMIMRRLAQFVRLHLSRVCVRLLASMCVCLTSVVLSRVCSRLCASARVCVRLLASVCVCSRLCASVSRLCASARVCVRLLASVCVCVCVRLSRVCVRRSSCLASVCVCLWELAHFMRLASFKEFKGGRNWLRFLLSVLRHTIPLLYI